MTDTLRHSVIFPGLPDEVLPWDMVGLRIPSTHLAKEKTRAHAVG